MKLRIKPYALTFFMISSAIINASGAKSQPLSLQDLVEKASLNAPKIKAAEAQNRIYGMERKTSVVGFLPSLDLNAKHGLAGDLPEQEPTESRWQSGLTLSLTENLYDNGVSWAKYESAKLGVTLGDIAFQKARDEVILEVIEAYFNYSLAEHLKTANLELEKTLSSQFRLTESQYRHGMKTRKDFLRFRGEVQRAQMENLKLEKRKQNAFQKILQLCGVQNSNDKIKIIFFNPRKAKLPPTPQASLHAIDTKDAKIFSIQNSLSDYDINFIRKNNLPQLNLTSELSYNASNYAGTSDPIYSRDGMHWGIILSLDYNILDFGTRRREVSIAIEKKNIQESNQKEKLQIIEEELQNLSSELKLSDTNYGLAQELLKFEEESFKIIDSEYRQGRASYLELLQGLQTLNAARTGYYRSSFERLRLIARYKFYEGNIATFTL